MKKLCILLSLGVWFITITSTVLSGCGSKKEPSGPPTGPPVTVLFLSTPAGATVYFDGDSIGVTPAEGALRLENVEWGEHPYRFQLKGYKTFSKKLNITSASTKRIEVELLELFGIEVVTDPEGATVYLDNERQPAGVAPLTIEDIPEGTHRIRVQKEGYFSSEREVEISKEAGASLYIELIPEPEITFVFAIYNQMSDKFLDEEPPLNYSYLRDTKENAPNVVYVGIEFAPARVAFNLKVKVTFIPRLETKEQELVFQGGKNYKLFEISEGERSFNMTFINPLPEGVGGDVKDLAQRGTYMVRVYYGSKVIAEESFEIK